MVYSVTDISSFLQLPLFRQFELLYNCLRNEHKFAPVERRSIMHEEYVKEITALIQLCSDIPTLDLIHQILVKKIQDA